MKTKITKEQFEDIQYADDLIVVEKTHYVGKNVEIKSLYVFESKDSKEASAIYERQTGWYSVEYFKAK